MHLTMAPSHAPVDAQNRPPKVLHLCTTTVDTHYFANLGAGLADAGLEVLMGSVTALPRPPWMDGQARVRYFSLGARSRLGLIPALGRLIWVVRREKPALLQTHLFHAGLLGYIAARLTGLPITITRHHTDEVARIGSVLHVTTDRFLMRHADKIVGLSEAVRAYAVGHDGAPPDRVAVLPQGFDFGKLGTTEEERTRVRRELGLEGMFVVGCVARFFPTKGHSFLVTAFDAVARELPDAHLVLVGGGNRRPIEREVQRRQLQRRVTFAGHRTDVPALMGAFDLLVHPSETEAFCQVIVEAMAVGTAVIATDVAAAREVITSGETGLLIPARDSEAIAEAIRTLYRNPELRQAMAARGSASVRARFTIDRMIAAQLEVYGSVLDSWTRGR